MESAGFGEPPRADFWIYQDALPTMTAHVPFLVSKPVLVDAFYAAAMAAGSRDNGKPSLRTQYCVNYYGAFALDPDGYNIEALLSGSRIGDPERKFLRTISNRG